jgi:methionyl-tRNA formyltransferase
MLPKVVWQLPEYGTINLHASLLPQYRGAAPIHWAVMNGEETTGITTFFINEEIDTGDILLQEAVAVGKDMDSGELHDVLKEKGASLLLRTVDEIRKGTIHPQPQKELSQGFSFRPAPKLTRQHCQINWDRPAIELYNMIRGLRPYPGAYTHIVFEHGQQVEMKIWKASIEQGGAYGIPGSLYVRNEQILVSCQDALIRLDIIQPAGKQRMETAAFLRGTSIPEQCL